MKKYIAASLMGLFLMSGIVKAGPLEAINDGGLSANELQEEQTEQAIQEIQDAN